MVYDQPSKQAPRLHFQVLVQRIHRKGFRCAQNRLDAVEFQFTYNLLLFEGELLCNCFNIDGLGFHSGAFSECPQLRVFEENDHEQVALIQASQVGELPPHGGQRPSVISYRGGDLIAQGNVDGETMPRIRAELARRDARLRSAIPAAVAQQSRDDPSYLP